MQAFLPLAVALLMGIVGGAVLVNILIGSRMRALLPNPANNNALTISPVIDAHGAEAQAQVKSLQTKLATADRDLEAAKKRCAELEEQNARVGTLEKQLASLRNADPNAEPLEGSALDQAIRVSELEQKERAASADVERLNKELSELREKLADSSLSADERQTKLETLEKEKIEFTSKLEQSAADSKKLTNELAELRAKLETSTTSAGEFQKKIESLEKEKLDLTSKQEQSTTESKKLTQELAELREKLEASGKQIKAMQKNITQLESEKAEASRKHDSLLAEQQQLKTQVADLGSQVQSERKLMTEKAALLDKARKQLATTLQLIGTEPSEEKVEVSEDKEDKVMAVASV